MEQVITHSIPMQRKRSVLEINVKMSYNNIWLLWQRKLRLWVVRHLHEPVSVAALTDHGDLFNSSITIIA